MRQEYDRRADRPHCRLCDRSGMSPGRKKTGVATRSPRIRLGSRVVAVALAAFAVWSLMAAGDGIYWMLRESRYVNDVMIPTVVLCLVLASGSTWGAHRLWGRRNGS